MCRTALHPFLERLPKCEHHIHIEGSLEPSLLFSLAAANGVTLPQDDEAFSSEDALLARYRRFTSLDDFLSYYYIGMSVLLTSDDFEALAWAYFQKASNHGVHHAEVFFDPQAHLVRGIAYSTIIKGFAAARERAQRELGISTLLISCFLRHLPAMESIAVFDNPDVQTSYENGDVVGIGLDSSEKDFPPHLFKELYAKAGHLKRTAHAGEEGPVEYIKSALDGLGIQRIDHGLRLSEDPELMKSVAANGTLLTLCPLSNVLLRCVDSVAEIPIRQYLDAGVKFSINSDDPAYFGGNYILDNYCAVHEAFNLSLKEWSGISRAGIDGSWCSLERKAEMIGALEKLVAEWESNPSTAE
jgi:adenosine deaminase